MHDVDDGTQWEIAKLAVRGARVSKTLKLIPPQIRCFKFAYFLISASLFHGADVMNFDVCWPAAAE